MTNPVEYIVIEYDTDPDMSWLTQNHYDPRHPGYEPIYPSQADMEAGRNAYDGDWYRDPTNHVLLQMIAYDADDEVVDSLGGIDFLKSSDDWLTGIFRRVSSICNSPYLQEIAREMGLRE